MFTSEILCLFYVLHLTNDSLRKQSCSTSFLKAMQHCKLLLTSNLYKYFVYGKHFFLFRITLLSLCLGLEEKAVNGQLWGIRVEEGYMYVRDEEFRRFFILSETCFKTKTYTTFCRNNTQTSTESRRASVVFNTAVGRYVNRRKSTTSLSPYILCKGKIL